MTQVVESLHPKILTEEKEGEKKKRNVSELLDQGRTSSPGNVTVKETDILKGGLDVSVRRPSEILYQ